jgi:hypothetical protein
MLNLAKISYSHATILTPRTGALLLTALLLQVLNAVSNHLLLDGSVAPASLAGVADFYF